MTVARAVWRQVEAGDYGLMLRVHRWLAPRPLQVLMVAATRLGDGWLWWMLGVALLFFGGPHRFVAISAGATAAGLGILIFCGLKHASRRRRPFELVPHCWSTIPPPDRYSFPSGHTVVAAAVVVAVWFVADVRWRPAVVAIGVVLNVLVGGVTVVQQWHRPGDVVSAYALVVACACAAGAILARWPDPTAS